jgi:uncharacterized protein YbjT (DUF2867 family)
MIFVTGAGGTVGGELVKKLLALGVKFRAGYHSSAKAEEAKQRGVNSVAIDFANPEALQPLLRGVVKLFLISGNVPHQDELELNVVREAKKAGVRHIVKNSVWGAESEAFSFANVHRPVEREIESSGVAYTLLRPNGYMQNMSSFYAQTIKTQGAFYLPAGEARISHIDVRDIASVAAKVLTETGHEGKAYDLSGPEALTYSQIAEKLSAATGKKVSYTAISDAEFKRAMVSSRAPEEAADAIIGLLHFYLSGQASRISPAVRQITGKEPISFSQYARDYAASFLQEARAGG